MQRYRRKALLVILLAPLAARLAPQTAAPSQTNAPKPAAPAAIPKKTAAPKPAAKPAAPAAMTNRDVIRLVQAKIAEDHVVPARRLEFLGGYAGLWKVTFDRNSIKGPLVNGDAQELFFEARLNQNLDFKARFDMDRISQSVNESGAPAPPRAP